MKFPHSELEYSKLSLLTEFESTHGIPSFYNGIFVEFESIHGI
jgi:hypothetical protein